MDSIGVFIPKHIFTQNGLYVSKMTYFASLNPTYDYRKPTFNTGLSIENMLKTVY